MKMKTAMTALTQTQLGIYLEWTAFPDRTTYNTPFLEKLPEDIDVERLRSAVRVLTEAHPVLSCVIRTDDQGNVLLSEEGEAEAAIIHLTDEEFEHLREDLVRPFEAEGEPLSRFEIYVTPSAVWFFRDVHHIILDGMTAQVLGRDLGLAYDGKALEAEKWTYRDEAADEAEKRQSPAFAEGKAFYEKLLDGCDTDSAPARDAFGEEASQGWLTLDFSLDQAAFSALRKKEGISTTAFFTAAAGYACARYNYADSSVISTIYSGRADEKYRQTADMLVRTLPFVTDIGGSPSVGELLKKAQTDLEGSRAHTLYSFMDLASEFDVRNDISFAYQGHILDYSLIGGHDGEVIRLYDRKHIEETHLLLEVSDRGEGNYSLHCGYREDFYSWDFACGFARSLIRTAQEFLIREKTDEILMTDEQDISVLDSFNETDVPYDETKTIVDLFRERAKADPEHVCVVCGDISLTYAEVDTLTDSMAAYLAGFGMQKGRIGAVLIPRSEDMVLLSLALLKTGAAYLPLDPSYPPERLNLMVRDSGASLLITVPALSDIIDESFAGPRFMAAALRTLPPAVPHAVISPDDLLTMLYTSGSTGLPKGVLIRHSNLTAFTAQDARFRQLTSASRQAAYASYGFDANLQDMWTTLSVGASLYIIPQDMRLDLKAVHDYFRDMRITHSMMTTQIGRQFAELGNPGSLQSIMVGGEKLAAIDPPDYTIFNGYGPTETIAYITAYALKERISDIPIGSAVDNVRLYVVDKACHRLPVGAAGELWIAGPRVTGGYLNRPEKTAEAYTENPFTSEEKYRPVYRTGDVVRYLPDGNIQFIGRRDAQVKIRGFRIELTEVEEVIRRCPGIRDVTVAAFDDPTGGKYLAAYVVTEDGRALDTDAVNAFIAAEKPPYMVPAVTMQIDRIPYNQNQKVNKKALPLPERKAGNIVPPENEDQRKICDILAGILGHREFGIDTDIYEAGLTSIGAVQFNVQLSSLFNCSIRTRDIKENSTVRKLADLLAPEGGEEKADGIEAASGQVEDVLRENESSTEAGQDIEFSAGGPELSDYPLTKTQMGIFAECLAHPDSILYNIPLLLEIDESLDTGRLKEACAAAVNAHPYILTRLSAGEGGEIRQKRTQDAFTPDMVEERTLPDRDAVASIALESFRLIGGRLFEIVILTAADSGKRFLLVDMHHIISDGTSLAVLLEDIGRAYAGEKPETEVYSGFDAAAEEMTRLKGPEFERAKAFYERLLTDADKDCLPPRTVRAEEESSAVLTYASGRKADVYRSFCEKTGISMSTLFNGAFGYVLGQFLHKNDCLYATVYNGRNDLRRARILAMLVKTFPVRSAWDEKMSVSDYLNDLQDQMQDSMTNDICSFAELVHDHGISADILFTYQGDSFVFDSFCGKKAQPIDMVLDSAKAPMDIDLVIRKDCVCVDAVYRSDLYDEAFMKSLTESIVCAADSLIEKESMSDLSCLTVETAEKLRNFNDTAYPVPDESVCRMFEREAKAHPDRTAVNAGGIRLTYRELNVMANRLAHALIGHGVKTGEVMGLIVPRKKEAFAGELAILKSGAAFLPMVPEYPDDRISFCLKDAACRFVLTTEDIRAERQELFAGVSCQVLTFEELLNEQADSGAEQDPGLDIPSSSLAYCIYTSGSTGTPKGVMITQGNLRNFLDANEKNPETGYYALCGHVVLSVISVAFDFSIMETQLPLAHGLTVCMADEEMIHDPIALAHFMKENGVDTMSCTPSFIGNMVDVPEIREALGNMKLYDFGAEAFPSALYEKLRAASPDAVICNGYGPTETTISCISKVLTSGHSITIGRPAANVKAYICDKSLHELPIGACGELVIGGAGVGGGYVGLPEKTAAVFVDKDGERVYRSGDLVRYLPDGEIEFFGRLDNQVKLRGFRVELDEISNTINSFPGIITSIVVVRNNGSFDYLAGFYTADREIDSAALTAHLREKLTYYMVPPVLIRLESMPLTVNGKVDKKKLPESVYSVVSEYTAPATETEKQICAVCQEVLGLERVGALDNFFEIGGTSLTATNVVLKMTDAGYSVVYKNIFDYPTPRELAAFLTGETVKDGAFRDSYSYGVINEMISANSMARIDETTAGEIGDIILTGAAGFLGIHILYAYLTKWQGHITCLVRRGRYPSPEDRLKNMWIYYFGEALPDSYRERISCVEADITDRESLDALKEIPADTIINCAALVKHFVQDDSLDRINVGGVENLIDLALSCGKRLIQVSTTSVGGVLHEDMREVRIKEDMLFFDQIIDNDYIRTKFLAERALLEARADRGLRGAVIRVGNLMSRSSDGEFQINFVTSSFMRSLKAYRQIGVFPMSQMHAAAEFSPIDSTAEAILKLTASEENFSIFHAYNSHIIYMSDVIAAMQAYGFDIRIVDDETFAAEVKRASADPALRDAVLGIIAYQSDDTALIWPCEADNRFTTEILYRLGWLWPITDKAYLENVIAVLDGFGFFDE